METTKDYLRREIVIACRANNVPVTGDMWFMLIFASIEALQKIAADLNIKTK